MIYTVCGIHTGSNSRGVYVVAANSPELAEDIARNLYGRDFVVAATFIGDLAPVTPDLPAGLFVGDEEVVYADDNVQSAESEGPQSREPFHAAQVGAR